jgi:hypothetical protein
MLAVMAAGALLLVVGAPEATQANASPWSAIRAVSQAITRATPFVLVIAALVGFPLNRWLVNKGTKWFVILPIAIAAGAALGLFMLLPIPFIGDRMGYLQLLAIYVSVAGVWCAFWGQLLHRSLSHRPKVGVVLGLAVVAIAVVGIWI